MFTVDDAYQVIKGNFLEPVVVTGQVKGFYLRQKPNSRLCSTLILETPEGVILTGDITPASPICMARGYSLDWFAAVHELDYLAGKFLRKSWRPDAARQHFQGMAAQLEQDRSKQLVEILAELGETDETGAAAEMALDPIYQSQVWRVGLHRTEIVGTLADVLRYLLESENDVFESPNTLHEALPARKVDRQWVAAMDAYDMGGMDFSESELAWLGAIQRRFAETYRQFVFQP